ncbi:DegT/DnrJ/EryC1/StrS family aminotransferase [Nitrosopumilus sp. S6]
MEKNEIISQIESLIKTYFSNEKHEFIPNETKIPIAAPTYDADEVIESTKSLLSTWVTMGEKVNQFEKMFAEYIGSKYAIMVNSGSSANLLALSILTNPKISKLKPGDEVITPALTWVTTVYPILNNGLKPVFVDADLHSFNIDSSKIEDAITEKTKAIMPVHLLGRPADIKKIKNIAEKHDLVLIEDTCEAHGAEFEGQKVGSFGDLATFSFFLSHHITTIEGGMVLTNNEELYEVGKALRAFGWTRDLNQKESFEQENPKLDPRFLFINLGYNLRPTEIQGAFGIHQLGKLNNFIDIRRGNAEYLNNRLAKFSDILQLPYDDPHSKHCYFGYPILIKDNSKFTYKDFVDYLEGKKIETRPIMAGNIVEQPSSKLFEYSISGDLKNANKIMEDGIFLPNHQMLREKEREYMADSIIEFIQSKIN